MATIQSLGVGSGIDLDRLVRDLVAAERAPVENRLNRNQQRISSQLSALGEFKGALSALRDAAGALNRGSGFSARKATSGDTEVFTATARAGTAPGRFSVEVLQRAEASRVATAAFENSSQTFGSGTLQVDVGDNRLNITVDPSANSLTAIRDAINRDPDNRFVDASIINEEGGSRLVLTARQPGEENTISLSAIGGDGGLAALTSTEVITAGQDARLRIDGFEVRSATNRVDSAIDGVVINLAQARPGETIDLTVSEDRDSSRSAVRLLINRFNALGDIDRNAAGFNADRDQGGPLQGDATVRRVMSRIQSLLNDQVQGADPRFNSLPAIGVTRDVEGKLQLDEAALDRALDERPQLLTELFSGENGIGSRLESFTDSFLTSGGALEGRVEGLQNQLRDISIQREALELRLGRIEARFQRQFGALDGLIAQLNQTSDFLAQQFSALENLQAPRRRR